VHESLKQLVQQVERGTPPAPAPAPTSAHAPKPRIPFAERVRELAEVRFEKGGSLANGDTNGAPAKDKSPRNRLGAAIPDFQEGEMAPPFGRAKRAQSDEHAFDLDDLVAAARRAAQAAALRAEERSSGSRVRRASASPETDASSSADVASRRKRSMLIICAAVLLMISAALLYGRLGSKPEPEVTAPAAEQIAPLPQGAHHGTPTPETDGSAPAPVEPKAETPPAAKSGSCELEPEDDPSPDDAASEDGETGNFTEIAKSAYRPAASLETSPQPQLASLKPNEPAALPPGVMFSIEDPAKGMVAAAPAEPAQPLPLPTSLSPSAGCTGAAPLAPGCRRWRCE
jgi:localization factor PodJL